MLIAVKNHRAVHQKSFLIRSLCLFLLCLFSLTACATSPRERIFDEFMVIRAETGDSFSSLASRYLDNPQNDWQIAAFNSSGKGCGPLQPGEFVGPGKGAEGDGPEGKGKDKEGNGPGQCCQVLGAAEPV